MARQRRGRFLRAGVVAGMCLGLFSLNGCVLIGDSVSAFMTGELRTVVPVVDADFGRSLDNHGFQTQESAAQAMRRWAGFNPSWVIVQVGANDVNASGDPEVWRASIRRTLEPLPTTKCVAWVLVYDVRQPERSDQFNVVVAEELARSHPKHVLVPWPDAVKGGGMLVDDVHLSPLGKSTLTAMVGDAVNAFATMSCG